MAGRIRDDDVALVRERVDMADVVREYVTLRTAGAGSLKGLCPFHEEKSPSFHIRPQLKHYNCFGCGESGDVFDFVRKLENLTFPEAVERLAPRAGVQLRYEQGGATPRQQSQRTRLIEAHRAAADFYAEQLAAPGEAEIGRRFLQERGFDAAAAQRYSVGYAPGSWDALTRHLRGRGFTNEELLAGGLAREGTSGLRDRFVGRLVWPIADLPGDVVGFGARRLREDDPGPKYLNTPETPIYRKSALLYGADLAKREIAKRLQVVLVEGYTDVMACHLSGVETAVATCGTAFGEDHVRIVRRLLADQNEFRGEVVFTFDGDEAGQRAALKAFGHEQRFVTQTFIAVESSGLDPCELRQQQGPEAVRELIARRVPLFEFAIRSALERYDLDSAEGRVGALREAAPIVAAIRDVALRPEYVRALAGWLGVEQEQVVAAVRSAPAPTSPDGAPATKINAGSGSARANATPPSSAGRAGAGGAGDAGVSSAGAPSAGAPQRAGPAAAARDRRRAPEPDDGALRVEREVLRLALQAPQCLGQPFDSLDAQLFTDDTHRAVFTTLLAAGGTASAAGAEEWVRRVREAATDQHLRHVATKLAVESLTGPPASEYGASLLARLEELTTTRRVAELKSRLQRMNPVQQTEEYNRLFGQLVTLEQRRRSLRELALGSA